MTPEERASAAVARIIDDMAGRKGLGNEWEDCDDDIQDEIRKTWEGLVFEAIVGI